MQFSRFQVRVEAYSYYEPRSDFISNSSLFQSWVAVLPEAGEFAYESKGHSGVVRPGEFVTIFPRDAFMRQTTRAPLTYHVMRWRFWNEFGQPCDHCWDAGKWTVQDTARYSANLECLRDLAPRPDQLARFRMELVWHEILLLAWQTRYTPDESRDPTMRQAARLIQEKAATSFSMAEVSSEVGLSPVQLTRRFRAAFGVTPIEYLTRVRLETTERLLINTDLTVHEIAARVGWSTENYLSSVFVKHRGVPPGQFRKLHRV